MLGLFGVELRRLPRSVVDLHFYFTHRRAPGGAVDAIAVRAVDHARRRRFRPRMGYRASRPHRLVAALLFADVT